MIKTNSDQIARWRIEIQNAEKVRDEQLGRLDYEKISYAGENIDYFETGISSRVVSQLKKQNDYPLATINIIFPIIKNIIPTLYYKNPYISVRPKKKADEESAPYCQALLNYYSDEIDIKSVNRQVIFDAYVLGIGVCKIGYATQFGADIPDEELEEEREKSKLLKIKEFLGLRKPKEKEEKQNIELNEYIRSESPYVEWVSPFNFLIDPSANSIYNARWVVHKITKILKEVKENPNYSNTSNLQGSEVNDTPVDNIPTTEIENFKTIDLYEIHYKTDKGINILTLAKDQNDYKPLRHEKSIYKIDGFQFEILTFNKHGHKLYPKSDIDIVKGLQDRISTTFDNILDQLDKYVPKLFVDESAMTTDGKLALRDGEIGAICYTKKDPNSVVKEANFTQIKGDLMLFIDKTFEIIMLETGLTRAQLMGMTNAQTATEAQIGQAGQNLRLSDKFDFVADYTSRQARKFWQVIQQFVDLEEIQLITGEGGVDDVTGLSKFSWYPDITSELAEKLAKGEYRFQIDVGNMEKPDLPILRQQIERMAGILQQPGVLQAFQMQGYKINLAEIFKAYLRLYPDVFVDVGKIIQPITEKTTGLIPPQMPQGGANINSQNSSQPPNIADILSGASGEKGQGGFPLA